LNRNPQIDLYAQRSITGGQEAEELSVRNTVSLLFNIDIGNPQDNPPQTVTQTLVETAQLIPPNCYSAVDKWIDLPAYGNVNPLGSYDGKDVICAPGKGLVELDLLSTHEGVDYVVPRQRIETGIPSEAFAAATKTATKQKDTTV